ncbi:MAG: DUF5050 domain-containing protein [Clostridiales bacterium]|nr:DUF5050 domain-containing protein [Clostridiales bacterium]
MAQIINYTCPSCGSPILHDAKPDKGNATDSEFCSCCQRRWTIKELDNKPSIDGMFSAAVGSMPAGDALVAYADDAESALAYLENCLDTYNWDDFILTNALTIPEIDRMVDKILVKSAANPATWELQFKALSDPLLKKINGLATLEEKFFAEYVKSDDLANAFTYYDAYSFIASTISAKGSDVIKKLDNAIKYYKKYKGNPAVATQLSAQLSHLQQKIASVKPVSGYKELPGYEQAYQQKQKNICDKLSAQGIDAEEIYTKAVADYKAGADRRATLAAFTKIDGYKDAEDYVKKLDAYFSFSITDGLIIRLGNKYYILKEGVAPAFQLNLGNKQQAPEEAEQVDGTKHYDLYEIKDTKQEKKPVIKGITDILAHFGGYLVYIKEDKTLCTFNSNAAAETAETEVHKAGKGDFNDASGSTKYFISGTNLYITTKLKAVAQEKAGCFASLFKKKKDEVKISNRNNYALLSLNLVNGTADTVIPELIDIMDRYGNQIFYTTASKGEHGEDVEMFYSFNMDTKKVKSVLSADTQIVDVVDGKVIYFLWVPNNYNMDLYSLNLANGEKTKLDKNVYDYYATIDGKIYYYIGNNNNVTLYSINTDGSDKQEIMPNAGGLGSAVVRSGWLYIKVGRGLNAALKKISVDGKKSVVLCTQYDELIDFQDGYVYYLDTRGALRIVREDGSANKVILNDVKELVKITRDAIYLLKREYIGVVDAGSKGAYSKSLYKVDKVGHNLTKIAFDVSNATENKYDDDELYLYKTSTVTYSVSVPTDDKGNYDTHYETRKIKSLLLYNIVDDTFKEVAVFGRPDDASFSFQSGCLKKKTVTKNAIIKEIPNKVTYQRKGKMSAGAIGEEQVQQSEGGAPVAAKPASQPVRASSSSSSSTKVLSLGMGKITNPVHLLIVSIVLYVISGLYMGLVLPRLLEFNDFPIGMVITSIIGAIVLGAGYFSVFRNANAQRKAAKAAGQKADIKYTIAMVIAVIGLMSCVVMLGISFATMAECGGGSDYGGGY